MRNLCYVLLSSVVTFIVLYNLAENKGEQPREILWVFHDGYNDPRQRPMDHYIVLTKNGGVVRIFASEETVYEVWRPANKNGWDTVYNRLSPEKSEMTEEKVQRLFFEMLKLTVPTEDSSKKEENKDKEITVMTLRHSA